MKKGFFPVFVIVLVVVCMVCLLPFTPHRAFAQINCIDMAEYPSARQDQVPVPWVFWLVDADDPTIYMPWVRLSPSSGESLYIRWYYAFFFPPDPNESRRFPSLDELFWDTNTDQPASILGATDWIMGNPDAVPLNPAGVMLDAPLDPIGNYGAVLVALEVLNEGSEVIGHSISEAIIRSESGGIVEFAVNFDTMNTTGHSITGFELDFSGIWLSCFYGDVLDAQGFIVGEEGNWGYDPTPDLSKPLIVIHSYSPEKSQLMWADQERPLENHEWVHLGIHCTLTTIPSFIINDTTTEVTGYMTSMDICDDTDADADGFSECAGDCDDADPEIYPGAPELCDGKDNDCDPDSADGADEMSIGEPCDGLDTDFCEEGSIICLDGALVCSDTTDDTVEICNGLDDDCDGVVSGNEIDDDNDGYFECEGDCDDADPNTYPGAPELCDGMDNNCDGVIDEGCVPPVCEPLTQGFWKRICDGLGKKKPHPETPEGFGDDENAELCGCVQVKDKDTSDPCVKADAQYAALLFNIKYGFLTGSCKVDQDVVQGILNEHNSDIPIQDINDVEDVAGLIASLLEPVDRDPDDCKLAQALADAVNTRLALADE